MNASNPDDQLAAAIAHAAAREDPSLPLGIGVELAQTALAELRQRPEATPGGLARRVLDQHPQTDVSWANHVARLALLLVAHD